MYDLVEATCKELALRLYQDPASLTYDDLRLIVPLLGLLILLFLIIPLKIQGARRENFALCIPKESAEIDIIDNEMRALEKFRADLLLRKDKIAQLNRLHLETMLSKDAEIKELREMILQMKIAKKEEDDAMTISSWFGLSLPFESEANSLSQEDTTLQSQHSSIDNEISELSTKGPYDVLTCHQDSESTNKKKDENHINELDELYEVIAGLEEELAEERKKNSKSDQPVEAEQDFKDEFKLFTGVTTEVQTLKEEIDSLNVKLISVSQQYKSTRLELELLKNEITERVSEVATANNKIKKLKNQLEESEKIAEENMQSVLSLRSELIELKQTGNNDEPFQEAKPSEKELKLESHVEYLTESLSSLKEHISFQDSEITDLNSKVIAFQTNIDMMDEREAEIKVDYEEHISTLDNELNYLRQTIIEMKITEQELRAKNSNLSSDLELEQATSQGREVIQ